MPVVYTCPHCHNRVAVPDGMLGQVVGCTHCHGPFQTLPAPPPMQPAGPPVYDLDDAEPIEPAADPNDFSRLDTAKSSRTRSQSRYGAGSNRAPIPTRFAVLFAVIGGCIMMFVNQGKRRPGKAIFDVEQIMISALVGGACAALGFLVGKFIEGSMANNTRERRY